MSLTDELKNLVQSTRSRCRGCDFYLAMEPQAREWFDRYVELIRQEIGTRSALYRVCRQAGLDMSERGFRDHVNHHHDEVRARCGEQE